jgi:hypothetical protein
MLDHPLGEEADMLRCWARFACVHLHNLKMSVIKRPDVSTRLRARVSDTR